MLGDKIRFYREVLHLSQAELAEKIGVPYQNIVSWENNQTQPTVEQINALAKLFGVPANYLLQSSAPVNPAPVARPVAPQSAPVNPAPVARPVAPQPAPVNPAPVARPVAPQSAPVNPAPVARPVAPQSAPVNPAPAARPVAPQPAPVAKNIDDLDSEPTIIRPSTTKTASFKPIPVEERRVAQPVVVVNASEVAKEKAEKEIEKKKNSKFKAVIIVCAVVIAILLGVILFFVLKDDAPETVETQQTTAETVLTAEDIYEKISPSVVEITAESDTMISTGTGFFYDEDGTVVTNYHVIENCQTAIITLADGTTYDVISVLGYDADRDIAVLATECDDSTPLTIRTSAASTGESVYALGSSLGLTGSLSNGIVSAVDREVDGNLYIQTTAPISTGNSGGPLVDSKGRVIGIVCASFVEGQNLNLAIPINDLNNISMDENVTLERLFPVVVSEVEWLSDYRFQYYDDEDVYVLLFQLSDVYEVPMSASGTVEIQIVNDYGETVYYEIHRFTESNFEEWIYYGTDEMYLCTIYVAPEDIVAGETPNGTCYFEVSGNGFYFEECSYDVDDLPTE